MPPTADDQSDETPTQNSGAGTSAKRAPLSPSICRSVIYHGHGHPVPSEWPATVQRVNPDGSLKLFVMGAKGAELPDNVIEGTGVGQWSWPVIG